MSKPIRTQLRIWALLADVITQQHCSHDHRERQLDILLSQLWDYKAPDYRPLWVETLIALAEQAKDSTGTAAHPHVKNTLILFRETCHHMADNWGEHWLSFAEGIYDEHGYIKHIKNNPTTRPIYQDPFIDWADNNLDDDTSDFDPLDDFPLP